MKTVGRYEVSNVMYDMIVNNLYVHEKKPMTFVINNPIAWGMHTHTSNKIDRLTKWVEKHGAILKVVGAEYGNYLLEITDPISGSLENELYKLNRIK